MKRFNTINMRLSVVTLCIAIPTLLIIFFWGFQEQQGRRADLLLDKQGELNLIVSQLDTTLELLENSIITVSDNIDLQSTSVSAQTNTEFWLTSQDINRQILDAVSITSLPLTPFLYFPNSGIFFNSQVNPQITQALISVIGENPTSSLTTGWRTITCYDHGYLYYLVQRSSFCMGVWIDLSSLQNLISPLSPGEVRYFTDLEGNVLNQPLEIPISPEAEQWTDPAGDRWWLLQSASLQGEFSLVTLLGQEVVDDSVGTMSTRLCIAIFIFLVLFLVYILCIYRWISVPILRLRQGIQRIRGGDLHYRLPGASHTSVEFEEVTEEFNALMDHIQQLKIQIYETQLAQKETKLQSLSQQIQPHFILNTLNTLYNYSESDIGTAQKIIRLVSRYYRYVVNIESKYVGLGQELEHIENYLSLQKLRYGSFFEYHIHCSKELSHVLIPPFLIESFVGNAIKYGRRTDEIMELTVVARQSADHTISITISDTGNGFSEDVLDAFSEYIEHRTPSEELGVGICNAVARLELIYGKAFSLSIRNQTPHGAVVEIILAEYAEEENHGDTGTCN